MSNLGIIFSATLVLFTITAPNGWADQALNAPWTTEAPVIDGLASEAIWAEATGIVTHDTVANIDVELKALHSGDKVYFLVRFPDPDRSVSHRSWVWNAQLGEYEPGNDREDAFVIKWLVSGDGADLSLTSVQPYTADIWFWKSCRTNPVGYADDKTHYLGSQPVAGGREILDKAGEKKYLVRSGDSGTSAYRTRLVVTNEGRTTPRFDLSEPTGSRSDVRAKGVWAGGIWTIEFSRRLGSGDDDDVQFSTEGHYQFGVSRYEIAGRKEDPAASQPKYGCGDVSEVITLRFSAHSERAVQ